jgi:hypothetical protein
VISMARRSRHTLVCRTPGRQPATSGRVHYTTGRWSIPTRLGAGDHELKRVRVSWRHGADPESEVTLVPRCAHHLYGCVRGTGSSPDRNRHHHHRRQHQRGGARELTFQSHDRASTVQRDRQGCRRRCHKERCARRDSRHPTARPTCAMPRDRGFRADRHDLTPASKRGRAI